MQTRIKTNYDDDNLYCVNSKELIPIGDKYIEIEEECYGEIITKTYSLEYAPTEEDEEDPYISE